MTKHLLQADGQRLRRLRRRLGWTQEEAAQQSGYSDRVIRKAEKNGWVRPKTLKEIVACYQAEIGDENELQWTNFHLTDASSDSEKASSDQMERAKLRTQSYYHIVFQDRRLEWIRTFISPSIQFTSDGVTRQGVEVIEQRSEMLLDAFDPIEITIEQLFGEGDAVVISFVARMLHVGEFFGISATGQWVNVRNCSILRFENELCVEALDQTDMSHLLHQLRGEKPPVL